jgi:8-oxo-dGTP pyrophosphatase MutT (NUDIX family)
MSSNYPAWIADVVSRIAKVEAKTFSRFAMPADFDGKKSAVLILFGETQNTPDVVIIQRSHSLRQHAGQPAFPGGGLDEGESAVTAALREAQEEIGLDASTVEILGFLPDLWVPVSGYCVTPVVGWWHSPHDIAPVNSEEVARVERVSIAELVDPHNRVRIRHSSGYVGPAFLARDLTIWGFTGGLLGGLLDALGYSQEWDQSNIIDLGE